MNKGIGLLLAAGGAYLIWKWYEGQNTEGETTNATNQNNVDNTSTNTQTTNAQEQSRLGQVVAYMKTTALDLNSNGPDAFNWFWNQKYPETPAPAPEDMGLVRGTMYTLDQWIAAMRSKGFSGLGNIVPSVGFGTRMPTNMLPLGSEMLRKRFN